MSFDSVCRPHFKFVKVIKGGTKMWVLSTVLYCNLCVKGAVDDLQDLSGQRSIANFLGFLWNWERQTLLIQAGVCGRLMRIMMLVFSI